MLKEFYLERKVPYKRPLKEGACRRLPPELARVFIQFPDPLTGSFRRYP
jgi:hypothetical protein